MFSKRFVQEKLYNLQRSEDEATSSATATPAAKQPGAHWHKRCTYHLKIHKKREEAEVQARLVRTRREVFMDPLTFKACSGDKKYMKLLWWLNNMCIQRSPDQVLFHKWFTQACLPKIYGTEEWNTNSERVMHALKLDKIRYEVTAITPSVYSQTIE